MIGKEEKQQEKEKEVEKDKKRKEWGMCIKDKE
jgi:hypothetical protein